MREKRRTERRPFSTDARCILPDGSVYPCRFLDISAGGAMLYFPDGRPELPARFIADLSGNIQVRRLCDLKWQKNLMAGVEFCRLADLKARRGPDDASEFYEPEPD